MILEVATLNIKEGKESEFEAASSQYQEWKDLFHHFYDSFPTVKHYTGVFPK